MLTFDAFTNKAALLIAGDGALVVLQDTKPDAVVVLDVDATLVPAHSDKEGAEATYKSTFGFHPLGVWCDNTRECLAFKLRPGNAGANHAGDHLEALGEAFAQIPAPG